MFIKAVLLASLFSSTLALAEMSKEIIDAVMRQRGFPNSDWPYYEAPNGCTNSPDKFAGQVSFHEACDKHDRCYNSLRVAKSPLPPYIWTASPLTTQPVLDSQKQACDTTFGNDLAFECKRQLKGIANVQLPLCIIDARIYQGAVASYARANYLKAQEMQKQYLQSFEQMKQDPAATNWLTDNNLDEDLDHQSPDEER